MLIIIPKIAKNPCFLTTAVDNSYLKRRGLSSLKNLLPSMRHRLCHAIDVHVTGKVDRLEVHADDDAPVEAARAAAAVQFPWALATVLAYVGVADHDGASEECSA